MSISYSYSFDNESFTGSFDSVVDAIADANSSIDEGDHKVVFVGGNSLPDASMFFPDADTLIDHMSCQAYDYASDHADNFPDVDEKAEEELTKELHSVLNKWCKKHDVEPTFFLVNNAKKYDLKTGNLAPLVE